MVDCSQFLEGYSSFRDGELPEVERAGFEAHRAACPSCARYDRVIAEGVLAYHRVSEIEPSEDFLPRLQHRIYALEEEMRAPARNGSGSQAALVGAIAATLAAIAWAPAAMRSGGPDAIPLPAVAARAPLPPPPPIDDAPIFVPVQPGFGYWNAGGFGMPGTDPFFPSSPMAVQFSVQAVSQ